MKKSKVQGPRFKVPNPKSEGRNPKEIRNPKAETRKKSETRNPKPELAKAGLNSRAGSAK
jgi:hypothetical protein